MSAKTSPSTSTEELSYWIELWHESKKREVEKVLARAVSAHLARAIFHAAMDEHPNRRITLRKGNHTLADTSG
jgi:hypothetical protein